MLPFNATVARNVTNEIYMIVRSNAIGIPLIAVVQGSIAYAGYLVCGVPSALFWGVVTCFATILPVVGTALVWVPLAAYLAVEGSWGAAVGLMAYGVLVVTQSDNVIRFILQKRMADTHPLVTILGVLIGLPLFGFMGVIFGPLLLAMFVFFANTSTARRPRVCSFPTGSSPRKRNREPTFGSRFRCKCIRKLYSRMQRTE